MRNFMSVSVRTALLTGVAMIAFAANSLLCRLALGQGLIDSASFTSVRVFSGAGMLSLIVLLRGRPENPAAADWRTVAALLTYMVFFSFAYLSLAVGTGALILFGSVQLTMFVFALRGGERFPPLSWAGFAMAVAGLVYLVAPGVTAPDPLGAVFMAVAGMAWGIYSLLGRGSADAIGATTKNFVFAVPLALVVSLFFLKSLEATPDGLVLAAVSGAIASGCGYAIWYAALPNLTATGAAIVQLTVPVIAALGGAIVLSEQLTPRLLFASAATIGGVAIVLGRRRAREPSSPPTGSDSNI
jgi:drug/metabolite transporter (DMT)-like permease